MFHGVLADLDSIIWVFDRGYTHYHWFCQMKYSDDDFVTLLQSDARLDVLKRIQNVEVTVTGIIRWICSVELISFGRVSRRRKRWL